MEWPCWRRRRRRAPTPVSHALVSTTNWEKSRRARTGSTYTRTDLGNSKALWASGDQTKGVSFQRRLVSRWLHTDAKTCDNTLIKLGNPQFFQIARSWQILHITNLGWIGLDTPSRYHEPQIRCAVLCVSTLRSLHFSTGFVAAVAILVAHGLGALRRLHCESEYCQRTPVRTCEVLQQELYSSLIKMLQGIQLAQKPWCWIDSVHYEYEKLTCILLPAPSRVVISGTQIELRKPWSTDHLIEQFVYHCQRVDLGDGSPHKGTMFDLSSWPWW